MTTNRISKIPPNITKLKKLKVINLNDNYFNEIPIVLFELLSLEEIYLSNVNNELNTEQNVNNEHGINNKKDPDNEYIYPLCNDRYDPEYRIYSNL